MPISQGHIAVSSSFLGIFHHALSKYVIASHNFTNSSFCDVTLYHSIREGTFLIGGVGVGRGFGGEGQ